MCLYDKGRFSGVITTEIRYDIKLLYTIPSILYIQAKCFSETFIKTNNTKMTLGPKDML